MHLTREQKVALITQLYTIVLCFTNWRHETTWDREVGLTVSAIDLRGTGALIGGIISAICLRRIWSLYRQLLSRGAVVPSEHRIWGRFRLALFLLPMLLTYTWTESIVIDGDVPQRTTITYGGGFADVSMAISAFAILAFQTVVELESLVASDE
ncbi:hypothetical protein [Rhodopirellula bahusiensis]|uniref:hypothetical protein n=1 Tax=Rhodopirellula bahusiensis TaxID=2014065 RepID=UPI003262E698